MTRTLTLLLLTILMGSASSSADTSQAFNAELSLVEIEVTKKAFDYKLPWVIRNQQIFKNGVVMENGQILTTADGFSGQYFCRVRKGGVSKQYTATLDWIDYYSNLAILSVDDEEFWSDMKPIELIEELPQSGNVQVYRWRTGRIESRAAEIIRLYIGASKMSFIEHLQLSASSEIDSAGWAEVVVRDGALIGLTSSASREKLNILPAPFIRSVLEDRKLDANTRVGYFDFSWMPTKNPALKASKGFDRIESGVLVTEVGKRRLAESPLVVGDIVFEIDGFEIDKEGKYLDPDYGRLSLAGLATRKHCAGDPVQMKVWRDGQELRINYKLPQPDFEKSLIPHQLYDQAPKYLIAGGLVFQPLNGPLLKSLGKNKPTLIEYYVDTADEERGGLVVLSMVLPDDFNRDYESVRMLIVDRINSQEISSLEDVKHALASSEDEFHSIHFMHDSPIQTIVLDAHALPNATERILGHYRIPAAESL